MPARSRPSRCVGEVRRFYDGPIILSGAIATGRAILAAQAMGADLAYIGTRFIATQEANAAEAYKEMIVGSQRRRHRLHALFHRRARQLPQAEIAAQGLDPDALPEADKSEMNFGSGTRQGLARHLGLGPGRRPDRRRAAGRNRDRPAEERVCRRRRPRWRRAERGREMTETILTETVAPGVMQITMNRPERKNALDRASYQGLIDAIGAAEADADDPRHGADRRRRLLHQRQRHQGLRRRRRFRPAHRHGFPRPRSRPRPSRSSRRSRVSPSASARRCCCIATSPIAGKGASFRMPFVALGLCPEGASSYLLPLIAGTKRAAELLMLGEAFGPETALRGRPGQRGRRRGQGAGAWRWRRRARSRPCRRNRWR